MSKRLKLEPVGRWTTIVIAAHVVVGAGLWWWLQREIDIAASPAASEGLVWMSPADFEAAPAPVSIATPSEPVAATTAPVSAPANPSPAPAAEPPAPAEPAPAPSPAEPAPAPAVRAIAIPPGSTSEDIAKIIASQTPSRVPSVPPPPTQITRDEPAAAALTASAPPAPMVSPPAPEPKPTLSALPPPPLELARFITVQHRSSAAPSAPPPGATLAEIAAFEASGLGTAGASSGVNMDDVDRAIMKAFTQNWAVKPEFADLPAEQRTAHLDVAVGREGQVLSFKLAKPSGNAAFDDSVRAAGNRVENIQVKLPAAFSGERYEFQLNFHAE